MKKIAVIGIMGAGKSTLSNKLSEGLGIEVHHLDKIYWKPGWIKIPSEEGEHIQREIIKKESWVFDGNWTGSMDIRLEPADTIIFLDFPKYICLYRVFKRVVAGKNIQPIDKAEGLKDRLSWKLIKAILTYPRKEILDKINKYSKGKRVYILHSTKDIDKFLSSII